MIWELMNCSGEEYIFNNNIGSVGDVADWKIKDILECLRHVGILQNTTTIDILLMFAMTFME